MEENVELLKQQYEAVKKQRDDIRYFLAELIESISSAAYNCFDLDSEKIVDEEGKRVRMFDGTEAYAKALGRAHYTHLSLLLRKLQEYDMVFDEHKHKAEIAVMLEKFKLPEEIEEFRNACRERKEEVMSEDAKKDAIKALATHLIIFSHEYDFSKNYPSCDRGIYSEAFMSMARLAMNIAGMPTTPEGIENALKEAYNGISFKAPSKRI